MKVRRLRDGAEGWAFRMAIPFTFCGLLYRRGWIAEVHGRRYVIADDVMQAHYVTTPSLAVRVLP